MKRRIMSLMIAIVLLVAILPASVPAAQAATSCYEPYAKIQYEYAADVKCGTIRYIAQNRESELFSWNYWPEASFGSFSKPETECGTACISMALSYVGVNRTPKELLESTNGKTVKMWEQQDDATSRAIEKSPEAVAKAMDDYINGAGTYSPLCIYIVPFSATSARHWVLLMGKIGENEYLALNPWHTPETDATLVIQIDGDKATHDGITNPIASIMQWHNPNAVICDHPSYDSVGVCTACGKEFDWKRTNDKKQVGVYMATGQFVPFTDKPYATDAQPDAVIQEGQKVEVVGQYVNVFGETWYGFRYHDTTYYTPADTLAYQYDAPLRVTCSGFSPANQAVLERKSHPVLGTVVSNYPLSAIYAYLDGEHFATWNAVNQTTTQVNLQATDVNYNLPFSSLADGKHTIELVAHSFAHEDGVRFHSSVFYIAAKTEEDTHPGKPELAVLADGDYVTFAWQATMNTTHYELHLSKQDEFGEWVNVETVSNATSGLSRTLEAGEYRAQLISCNADAQEPDQAGLQHTFADDEFFTIEADTYTISFDANGGTGAPTSQTELCGTTMVLPSAVPSKAGYVFMGWATDSAATTAVYQPGDVFAENADATLYAVWQADEHHEEIPETGDAEYMPIVVVLMAAALAAVVVVNKKKDTGYF